MDPSVRSVTKRKEDYAALVGKKKPSKNYGLKDLIIKIEKADGSYAPAADK